MKKINETFVCVECWREVPLAEKTCRNHCHYCFAWLHLDGEIPWDRNSWCDGKMYPIAYEMKNGDYRILFQCEKCGKQHRNKRAWDDEIIELPHLIQEYQKYFID